jgi:outer membrane protein with beta-barrel domain
VNQLRIRMMVAAALGLSTALPGIASAQHKQTRQGFWFNIGLGYGSLGCQDCSGRTGSLSGGLALGGTLSQKVVIGGGTNGWTKSENGATLTVSTLTALIRFYPSPTGGFFLLGGLGVGQIHGSVTGFGSATETGAGVVLGLGYDIRVGNNLSITPFWNGFAMNSSNSDANVAQIGLGLTVN